jgi:hypothetical protein
VRLAMLSQIHQNALRASQAHYGAEIPFDDLNAERTYRGFVRYRETKLANLLFRLNWRDVSMGPG